ncbi:hypothetical protein [Bacillus wiedmannii]|uniref:hypothetical protein n=1 Tax=Bacillus wiedmannii TaxID=1890302 RepID=UPI002E1CDC4E|nr:hypothetical protein [Bacillus wiedmannii]
MFVLHLQLIMIIKILLLQQVIVYMEVKVKAGIQTLHSFQHIITVLHHSVFGFGMKFVHLPLGLMTAISIKIKHFSRYILKTEKN